jgi:hypothetical protein
MYDIDTHQFVLWSDTIPAFNPLAHQGIPNNIFVHTPYTMVLSFQSFIEKKQSKILFDFLGVITFSWFNE